MSLKKGMNIDSDVICTLGLEPTKRVEPVSDSLLQLHKSKNLCRQKDNMNDDDRDDIEFDEEDSDDNENSSDHLFPKMIVNEI